MIVLNLDMDNTVIYSYKHDIGEEKETVEIYHGREISYVTDRTKELLMKLSSKVLIVPTTTRTQEQYERIDLKVDKFKYALVCNGGVLLENGKRNEKWLNDSKRLILPSYEALEKAYRELEKVVERYFEIRFIDQLFIFTKCHSPEDTVATLNNKLDTRLVRVMNNGDKIYVVPNQLDKGTAIMRFKNYIGANRVIAAGDSEFDVSMVAKADIGIVPYGFKEKYSVLDNVYEMKENQLFSEKMLSEVLEHL